MLSTRHSFFKLAHHYVAGILGGLQYYIDRVTGMTTDELVATSQDHDSSG